MTKLIVAPNTFLTYSLGCRTNQAEIEKINLQLTAYGLQQVKEKPDLILLNTCVVTQKAEKETRQKIREFRKKYPKAFLVVVGCAVSAKEKFKINLPVVDLFIPNHQKDRVIELLVQNIYSIRPMNKIFDNKYTLSGRKFIKIQDGCDKYCTFCITCHLRGKPISIVKEKIIEEINFWVKNEVKEIILTGINIGLYDNLLSMLNNILTETKIEKISFSSIYPEMLTDDFLKLVVGNSRFSQYFHLSLQSGSNTVLKRMNRKYDTDKLKNSLLWIKQQKPEFTFRADIITGFPQESEQEFSETLDFIKKYKVSFVHIFTYSSRKGTMADKMIQSKKWQNLSEQIKKERLKKIKTITEAVRKEEAEKMQGKSYYCLIVRFKNNQWEGITENGWSIRIKNKKSRIKHLKGKILPSIITGFEEDYLLGEIVSLPTY